MSRILVAAALLALVTSPAAAQATREGGGRAASGGSAPAHRTTVASRLTGAITLDGRLDEPSWALASLADSFTQSMPDAGQAATQRSEARVLFDAGALYVGMRLHDDHPDSVAATLGRRDFAGYSDWAHVIIDSYNDKRTAFRFAVNPAGVKRDGYITGDQEFNEDLGWDAVWDAAVQSDSSGWTVEFRIPLSQLRFSAGAEAEWGVQFARDLARRSERSTWTLTTPALAGFVSRFGTLRGVRPPANLRRLEAMPFTATEMVHRPDIAGDPFFRQNTVSPRLGLDFRVGITSDLTLTGTVAPDFGQVEADPSIVNLSGVENSFAERRPFFTEGSDAFLQILNGQYWVLQGPDQLFYSRRIGRTPQGSLPDEAEYRERAQDTRLLGALKLSGKTSQGWTLGALSALTEETAVRWADTLGGRGRSIVEPMAHYGVLRVAKDVAGGEGTLGAIVTTTHRRLDGTGLGELRDGAVVGGLTARRRFAGGAWNLDAALMMSEVRGSPEALIATQRNITHLFQRPDAAYLAVDSSATSMRGVAATATIGKNTGIYRVGFVGNYKSPGFEANDLGFVPRADVIHTGMWLGYDDFRRTARVRNRYLYLNPFFQTTTSGEKTMVGSALSGRVQFNSFRAITLESRYDQGVFAVTQLRGGPAFKQPARLGVFVRYSSDTRRRVSSEIGHFYLRAFGTNGFVHAISPTLTVRPSARAEFTVGTFLQRNRVPWQYVATRTAVNGQRWITGELNQVTTSLTTRLNYAFTPDLTLQLYAQPFLAAGRYGTLSRVTNPRAHRWSDRLDAYTGADRTTLPDGRLRLGQGGETVTIDDPDFSVAEFRGNAVLRWEYRPGSALFVVWSQRRDASDEMGQYDLARQSGALFGDGGTNVLTVKWSHWIGR